MAEATREFAIAKTMEILRAYVRKIEDARGYFDCLSPEGRRIVENYDNNVDGQKTLLLKASDDKDFFLGMPDDMVLAYADVCRKMNDRFDLNVKKVYPIEKITADLSLFEKIKKAIGYSDILGEILEEVGDINALVKQMALVSGGLIVLSFTGLGTVAEALGLALLLVGASFSGTELLAGITGLVKFFTEVYNAKTEEDLKDCGKLFGDAVAKIGVNGLFFVLSLFGLKKASIRHTTRTIAESKPVSGKWERKSFKEKWLSLEKNKIKAQLIEELKQNGIKCNEKEIVKILKMDNGKIIFLETGNEKAGFMHILKHENEFLNKNIGRDAIPELIFHALKEDNIIGSQGRGRPIYECEFNGVTQRVAITVGENGFVVGANTSK